MKFPRTGPTRWAVLDRFDIADLLDESNTYLTRWRIVQTPWFGLFLHAIRRPDVDRHLHDHPWSFVSIILRGGYTERIPGRARYGGGFVEHVNVERDWGAGSVHRMRATDAHAIDTLWRKPTWTLMLVGPRCRDWGYHTESGWVQHEDYHARRRSGALR